MAYISFVMSARNDNYGGNFVARIRRSLRSLFGWCSELGLDAEVIAVEWNPPANRPSLREELMEFSQLRIITVPEEYHRRMDKHEQFGLFEHYAKNVGIRRARGEWVLVTNADIIFSKEMIQILADMQHGTQNFVKFATGPSAEVSIPAEGISKDYVYCARRHDLKASATLDLDFHLLDNSLPSQVEVVGVGAGDFTLMHRDHWHGLRGYPQICSQRHVDTLLVRMAMRAGLQWAILAHPTYHQAHDNAEGDNRPGLAWDEFQSNWVNGVYNQQINDENWGLGNVELVESGGKS